LLASQVTIQLKFFLVVVVELPEQIDFLLQLVFEKNQFVGQVVDNEHRFFGKINFFGNVFAV
jgi:hypothetical protein